MTRERAWCQCSAVSDERSEHGKTLEACLMLDLYVGHTLLILVLMVMVMTKNRSYFKTTDKSMSKRCGPKPRRYVWTTTVIFWDTMQTRSSSLINNYILWTGRRPNLEQFVILLLNGFTNLPLWSFESKTRFFLLFSDNPAFAIIPPPPTQIWIHVVEAPNIKRTAQLQFLGV